MPRERMRSTSAREEPDIILIVHPTTEVLSQKRAEWLWVRLDVMNSSASQLITIPVNLSLLMVRVTALKISFTFCINSSCDMIGHILFRPDVQNHPVPITQISEYPI